MRKKEEKNLDKEQQESSEKYSFPKAGIIICASLFVIIVALIIVIYAMGGPY